MTKLTIGVLRLAIGAVLVAALGAVAARLPLRGHTKILLHGSYTVAALAPAAALVSLPATCLTHLGAGCDDGARMDVGHQSSMIMAE